jgi:hypothetical protein
MLVTEAIRSGRSQDLAHLEQQLFAAYLGTVGGRYRRHVDLCTAAAQGTRNAVEVFERPKPVKAEQAMDEDDGVAGLGIARCGSGM